MNTNPLCITLAIIALSCVPAESQESIKFDTISIEHGLSQSLVTSIIQDSKGFLWFGTGDGLNRYDGYNFEIFRHDESDPHSIDNNWINTIYEDHEGIIWIGTNKALNRFNEANNSFTHYFQNIVDKDAFNWPGIQSISEDSLGNLWIGTFNIGVYKLDKSRNDFTVYRHDENNSGGISSNHVNRIKRDRNGVLWILYFSNVLDRYNEETDSFEHLVLQDERISLVSQILDYDSTNWYAGTDIGLFRIDKETGDHKLISTSQQENNDLPGVFITDMLEDSAGTVWIASRNGLIRMSVKTSKFTTFEYDPNDSFSLSINNLNDLLLDRSGILWIATNGLGISYSSTHKYKFNLYQYKQTGTFGLVNNYVYSIFEDNSDNIWIGTNYIGLNKMNRISKEIKQYNLRKYYNEPEETTGVHSFAQLSSGKIYIGTSSPGLLQYDPVADSFELLDTPGSVRTMVQTGPREILVGMLGEGLGRVSFKADGSYVFDSLLDEISLESSRITCLLLDSSEYVWIGTEVGLHRVNLNTYENKSFFFVNDDNLSLSNNFVLSCLKAKNGSFWFGTRRGLNKYVPETDNFIRFTSKQGFPNDVIYGILEDNDSHLWLSTNKGLIEFDAESNSILKTYSSEDGLQSNEFNSGAYYRTHDGELFFGGINGANSFFPKNIKINTTAPQIVLTSILSFGKPIIIDAPLATLEELTLKYGERYISLEFAALDFNDPLRNQYKYMMTGVDPDWVDSGQRRFVNYNLHPGNYIFQVKGSNSDGIWNEEGIKLTITVVAPFWDTWWFKTIVAFLITFIVSGAFFMRFFSIRKQRDMLKKQVRIRTLELEQRSEELEEINKELESFSYMVSHDLRAPVRHIRSYSQLLLEEHLNSLDVSGKNYLHRIDSVASRMDNLIEDLLWLSRASHFNIEYSLLNLSGIAKVILNNLQQRFTDRTVRTIIEPGIMVKGDLRLVEVAMENLINNAWKFTSKNENAVIEFGFIKERNSIVYFIRDNGVGFQMDHVDKLFVPFERLHSVREFDGTGIGLATVEKIIKRHGGRIWADSTPDQGATFFFTLPGKTKSKNK